MQKVAGYAYYLRCFRRHTVLCFVHIHATLMSYILTLIAWSDTPTCSCVLEVYDYLACARHIYTVQCVKYLAHLITISILCTVFVLLVWHTKISQSASKTPQWFLMSLWLLQRIESSQRCTKFLIAIWWYKTTWQCAICMKCNVICSIFSIRGEILHMPKISISTTVPKKPSWQFIWRYKM